MSATQKRAREDSRQRNQDKHWLTIINHIGFYWDRLQVLAVVMQAGKSKEKIQNIEIKSYYSQ